jgi:hypothetical protein
LKIVPLEHDPVKARDYLDDRSLQIGHISLSVTVF